MKRTITLGRHIQGQETPRIPGSEASRTLSRVKAREGRRGHGWPLPFKQDQVSRVDRFYTEEQKLLTRWKTDHMRTDEWNRVVFTLEGKKKHNLMTVILNEALGK